VSQSCDLLVYERKELDPYVEKYGDFPSEGSGTCLCEDCRRFRSKYGLKGEKLNEEETYETVPVRVQEASGNGI